MKDAQLCFIILTSQISLTNSINKQKSIKDCQAPKIFLKFLDALASLRAMVSFYSIANNANIVNIVNNVNIVDNVIIVNNVNNFP